MNSKASNAVRSSTATTAASPALSRRPLGATGLFVSELGLGGLYTSSLGGGVEESIRLLQAARDLGVNYLDTAPAYADSEATLGPALAAVEFPSAAPLVISTKLGGRPQPFDPRDADALRRSFDESLRLLVWNGAIALAGIYWLNGFGITVTLVAKVRVPLILVPLLILLLLIVWQAGVVLTMLGFFDTWIEFRNRLAGIPPARPPDE